MAFLQQRFGLNRYEADEHYAMAIQNYENKKLAAALDEIGYALALLPNNPEYLATQGIFHLEDGVEDQARANFERTLKIHKTDPLASYGMGVLAYRASDWDAARAWFGKAQVLWPNRPELFYYLALIHHRQGENRAALDLMQRAHDGFEAAGDTKRRRNASRWLSEFEKQMKTVSELQIEGPPEQLSLGDGRLPGLMGPDAPQIEAKGDADDEPAEAAEVADDKDDEAP